MTWFGSTGLGFLFLMGNNARTKLAVKGRGRDDDNNDGGGVGMMW